MLIIAWTTCTNCDEAMALAKGAVEAGYAACSQVDGPITSFYTWKGELCSDQEYRVTLKAVEKNMTDLEKWIHQHHPYETPQWVAVKADLVSEPYLKWAEQGN